MICTSLLTKYVIQLRLDIDLHIFLIRVSLKKEKCGVGLQWDERMKRMVFELLSHCTPPICIAAHILTVAKILFPHTKIIKEQLSISFVRGCRRALSFFTKLLEAYQLGKANKFLEHHYDGTQRRQISWKNCIIRIGTEGGFKTVTLSSAILSEDETLEMVNEYITQSFKGGSSMLAAWRKITKWEYPGRKRLAWHDSKSLLAFDCK